ncbi:MAG: hypothetical protein ACRD5W_09115 [Candidatus Acidiferrales bacterium]
MSVRRILLGQVWKRVETGETFLVTKIYNEALATFAVMRKTGSETEAPLRVKVSHSGEMQTIPGFIYTQDSDQF